MQTRIVNVPAEQITSEESFHSVFQRAFGFFSGYGHNGDAWIDCMTWLDTPTAALSELTVERGNLVAIRIQNPQDFQDRCPDLFQSLVEMTAFVNWRRRRKGEPPLLVLLLDGLY